MSEKHSFWSKIGRKAKALLELFWSMFKIGLFTFGGGYAMIHLLENEFVQKKKWLTDEEFFDLVTIAESTPGPVAINCSTYIGYKTHKFIGSIVGTTAMCLPSFTIIFVISLFFDAFLANQYINAAFRGIQVCAIFLILCAGIKMFKKLKLSPLNILIFVATLAAMILVSIFGAKFSSIFYILISGGIGLMLYSIVFIKDKIKCPSGGIEPPAAAENKSAESEQTLDATCQISGENNEYIQTNDCVAQPEDVAKSDEEGGAK